MSHPIACTAPCFDDLTAPSDDVYVSEMLEPRYAYLKPFHENPDASCFEAESVTLDDLHARVCGDTAVLTGRYSDVSVTDGVRKESHALFTRVFAKTNGRWQAVAYQQTVVTGK